MMTLTGLPLSVSSEPALAANARGSSTRDGDRCARRATATLTGTNAAAAPLIVMSGLNAAARTMMAATTLVRVRPATRASTLPSHAVIPDASSPSLITNRAAMKAMTL